jgi:(1->4)-alpha-D-glucan 1-alpha-D-glucosylmutase
MEWADAVRQWSSANAKYRTGEMPDRKTEYLLYQTLAGAWPISRDRLLAYMRKAVREAKEHTNWTEPHQAFEEALEKFVDRVLGDSRFIADLERFLAPLAEPGRVSSLSLALLKLTAPGIPDLYQGTELWDWSLVDPDNRRPVDYGLRARLLSRDEHPKLRVIRKGLELRRQLPALFHGGSYVPLDGGENIVAFALRAGGRTMIAIAPRLFARLDGWGDARLQLPRGFADSYRNVLTSAAVRTRNGKLRLADLSADFPLGLLIDAT